MGRHHTGFHFDPFPKNPGHYGKPALRGLSAKQLRPARAVLRASLPFLAGATGVAGALALGQPELAPLAFGAAYGAVHEANQGASFHEAAVPLAAGAAGAAAANYSGNRALAPVGFIAGQQGARDVINGGRLPKGHPKTIEHMARLRAIRDANRSNGTISGTGGRRKKKRISEASIGGIAGVTAAALGAAALHQYRKHHPYPPLSRVGPDRSESTISPAQLRAFDQELKEAHGRRMMARAHVFDPDNPLAGEGFIPLGTRGAGIIPTGLTSTGGRVRPHMVAGSKAAKMNMAAVRAQKRKY